MATQFRSQYTGAQTDALLRKLNDTDWDNLADTCTDAASAASTAINTVQTKKGEAITAINTAKTDAVAEVESLLPTLETAIDNRIKKFYTSNSLAETVSDSDDGNIRSLKIYGKGFQPQYSGKNLLNCTLATTTQNGVTCTNNGDGTYTLNGTATATTSFWLCSSVNAETSLPNTFSGYKLVGCPSGGDSSNDYSLYFSLYNGTSWIADAKDVGNGAIVTDSETIAPRILTRSGCVCNNVIFKPMVTTDLTATYADYEPYTGGQPSPSPSYPQTVHGVVNPTVWLHGKNLCEEVINGYPDTNNHKIVSGVYTSALFYGIKGDTVRASATIFNRNALAFCGATKPTIGSNFSYLLEQNDYYTLDKDGYYVWYICNQITDNVQVELGSTATAYEPYESTTATLETTLNAIPVTSGGNVTIDGQQYIADYVDVDAKQIVRYVGKVDLGSLTWTYDSNASHERMISNILDNMVKPTWSGESVMLCSAYIPTSPKKLYDHVANNTIAIQNDLNRFQVYSTSMGTDTSAFKASVNGTNVAYLLATPTTESLTDDDIADFLALRSYYGSTTATVTSDDLDGASEFLYPCSMENFVEYIKGEMGDTRDFVYDMADISDEAYIQSLVNAINLELLMEE